MCVRGPGVSSMTVTTQSTRVAVLLTLHVLTPSLASVGATLFETLFSFPFHFHTDKQNELEVPCPVPKLRERKRRQGQQQQQQQQQQGGMMTQISGVRKVSHTPSISGGSASRFGVKTDQEELLSKVSGGTCRSVDTW